jgi:hypothetical protein
MSFKCCLVSGKQFRLIEELRVKDAAQLNNQQSSTNPNVRVSGFRAHLTRNILSSHSSQLYTIYVNPTTRFKITLMSDWFLCGFTTVLTKFKKFP